VLVGILVLLVVLALMAEVCGQLGGGPDVAIVSPKEGIELPAGVVVVRIRVDVSDLSQWELMYSGPGEDAGWQAVAKDAVDVFPTQYGGSHQLQLSEPGQYHLRLVAHRQDGDDVEDTADFVLTQ
jgi:hypothetical protein